MSAYLIDPSAQTVEPVELPGEFLDAVRHHVGSPQINVLAVAETLVGVWFDQMGMLRPGRSFWRFADSEFRYAGKCVLTGLLDGRPVPLPATVTAESVRAQIVFHPADSLERIVEELVVVSDEDGQPIPAVARRVIWRDIVQIPEVPPPSGDAEGFSIFERADNSYRIVGYRLREDGEMEPVSLYTAPNLDEARKRLPDGLDRIEPLTDEPDNVVEHWSKKVEP